MSEVLRWGRCEGLNSLLLEFNIPSWDSYRIEAQLRGAPTGGATFLGERNHSQICMGRAVRVKAYMNKEGAKLFFPCESIPI